MNEVCCSTGSVKSPTQCQRCGTPLAEEYHRPSTTTVLLCGRCCPVCQWNYRSRDEIVAIQQRLDGNEQHGPLAFREWAFLVQAMDKLYNGWPAADRLNDVLDRLCRALGLDWRELYCKYRLNRLYDVVANEQYDLMEEDLVPERPATPII